MARIGGEASKASGRAHKFTSETARIAGKKGGQVVAARPGHMSKIGRLAGLKVSADRKHMSEIARKGAAKQNGTPREDPKNV